MATYDLLLLNIWREACRHIEIASAIEIVTQLLASPLPQLDRLMIRLLDQERQVVDTIAVAGTAGESTVSIQPQRSECTPEQFEHILSWCRHDDVLHETAEALGDRMPGVLPDGLHEGEVFLVPLRATNGLGIAVFISKRLQQYSLQHKKLVEILLEPLTVVLENYRRLNELVLLREKVEAENQSLLRRLGRNDANDTVVGAEGGLRSVIERVALVAKADIPVLILGETGSGKEVVAREIHKQSQRGDGPFLRVNCGAMPPDLVDSELFGHEKGSFTGATGQRKGWFERANHGTLFLDECGELTPATQVRLLRILQEGSFERVGGDQQVRVDVRIVAATHRNLQKMIADGAFREDLWYRLAVFPIRLPPLRERIEDIPAMAAHFARRAAHRFGLPVCIPTENDLQLLSAYAWPGNVRELASVIDRAAVLGKGKRLEVATALGITPSALIVPESDGFHLQRAFDPTPVLPSSLAFASLDQAMREHIVAALRQTRGQVEGDQGAAKLLEINPHTLRARMRKLGVSWQAYRSN